MATEFYLDILIAAAPAIAAIAGCLTAYFKSKKNNAETSTQLMNGFEALTTEVKDSKQYEELKAQLVIAHQENRELKKKLNELLTKIDRISRAEEE